MGTSYNLENQNKLYEINLVMSLAEFRFVLVPILFRYVMSAAQKLSSIISSYGVTNCYNPFIILLLYNIFNYIFLEYFTHFLDNAIIIKQFANFSVGICGVNSRFLSFQCNSSEYPSVSVIFNVENIMQVAFVSCI